MSEDNLDLFLSYCDSPSKRGDAGEVVTAHTLRSDLGMKVVRNVYLPFNDKFTEIDIVAFSEKGIFIIENKNYSGVVRGSLNNKYWDIEYGYHKASMFNPVLQNRLHKDAFLRLFNTDIPIFSPVIFNDKATLKLRGSDKSVFTLSSFKEIYNSFNPDFNVNIEELSSLEQEVKFYSNMSDEMRILHVALMKGSFYYE